MPSRRLTSLLAGVLLLAGVSRARAQSLGDVGKKEEERRKSVQSGKVYTNDDLKPVPMSSVSEGADKAAGSAKGDDSDDAKPAKAGKGDGKSGDKSGDAKDPKDAAGGAKDQKYWRDRMDAARLALERDTGYADAMQTRINALTTDFVNRDDPSQRGVIERDRQRAVGELERLRKQVDDDKKAISDIEDEARRAGVPPGWLR